MNPLKSLKAKLLIFGSALVVITISVLLWISSGGLKTLGDRFIDLSNQRAESVKAALTNVSQSNVQNIRGIFETSMQKKGQQLMDKDAGTLTPMLEDNSFGAVRDFLKKTFTRDNDLILAEFFVVEDGNLKAWAVFNPGFPDGLELPIEFDRKTKAWKGKTKKGMMSVPDPEALTLLSLDGSKIREGRMSWVERNGERVEGSIYDCMTPVFKGMGTLKIADAKKKGNPVGYLRYTISLRAMERQIEKEGQALKLVLQNMENENAKAQKATRETGESVRSNVIGQIGTVALAILIGALLVSWIVSTAITSPVKTLTAIAQKMAAGDYNQKVDVTTGDEIGILASAFGDMSAAIRKRDEDLAEINKNLEKTVEERTAQLKQELKNIANLLNNMKQAVFQIGPDLKVGTPVSKFSETVFEGQIVGKNVLEQVYKDLDPRGEISAGLHTAMAAVFGEDDMQWTLMEDNFPSRVEWRGAKAVSPTDNKILKVAYNPVWDDNGNLEKVMFVIQDVTDMERLEREIAEERRKNGRRNQIIEDLASNSNERILEYFGGMARLMDDAAVSIDGLTQSMDEKVPLLRALHTIKGNSRVFKMTLIAAVTHEVENNVGDAIRIWSETHSDTDDRQPLVEALHEAISHVQTVILEYANVGRQIFRIENDFEKKLRFRLHQMFTELDAEWTRLAATQNGDADFAPLQRQVGRCKQLAVSLGEQSAVKELDMWLNAGGVA